jgi:hypothetical protein
MLIIHDKDGVPWHDAPRPLRLHFCKAWTYGWDGPLYVERCSCGAIRLDRHIWMERNTRKADA